MVREESRPRIDESEVQRDDFRFAFASKAEVPWLFKLIEFVGSVFLFGLRAILDGVRLPLEGGQFLLQMIEVGAKSLHWQCPRVSRWAQ